MRLPLDKPNHELRSRLDALGYLEPERILSARACRRFLAELAAEDRPAPEWSKGEAAASRAIFELATHEGIVARVAALLGEDVMLWGARLVTRTAQRVHPWHSDVETWGVTRAGFVTVWLGLRNTSRESSPRIVSRSHRFGVTVQQLRHEAGRDRDKLGDAEVLAWARARDPQSETVSFDVSDGEALFLDGRIWHSTRNRTQLSRKALLLQYATPGTLVRVPDLSSMDWPFRFFERRAPCLMVHGTDGFGVNRMVEAPPPSAAPAAPATRLASGTKALRLPLEADAESGWKPYVCFKGETGSLDFFRVHASALAPGRCPHPPHRHLEEELLLVLEGAVEIALPDAGMHPRLGPGDLVFYPANFAHTITAVGSAPANYFMVKWCDRRARSQTEVSLPFRRLDYREPSDAARCMTRSDGVTLRVLLEGATLYLDKLQAHHTTVAPGGGYEPHVDSYDVLLLVLEGEIETLGRRVGPHDVVFYAAGEPHGVHNPGETPAGYLVFEFHGRRGSVPKRRPPQSLGSKLIDPAAWRRLLASFRSRRP